MSTTQFFGELLSRDHKVIGKRFLWLGLGFLFLGGALSMVIRWQLGFPGRPVPLVGRALGASGRVSPTAYAELFTLHGTIMIFFAVTPLLIGAFGNYCIPLLIGARGMAFPVLGVLSFFTQVTASLVLLASFFLPTGPLAGWTGYPPLSTSVGTPGLGQTLWPIAMALFAAASLVGAINYITTVVRCRAPGMGWFRLPLTVWGFLLSSILSALFLPFLTAAVLLLFSDRLFGTHFYIAGPLVQSGGDPIIYQHLFWIFGHPEVYILIFPAWGIVSDLLSFFARKPAFAYPVTVVSLMAIAVISTLVYGHHMYVTSMSPLLGQGFMVLTMLVSLPACILFITWLGTLWRGSLRLAPPMWFTLGVVFVFGLGGLTGLYLAHIPIDIYLHDTYFVVGHFHLTMAAAVLLAVFAAIYFWYPKIFGRNYNHTLAHLHFWLSFLPMSAVFSIMLVVGNAGLQRRLFDPSDYPIWRGLLGLNRVASYAAFALLFGQIPFVVNFIGSLFWGARSEHNPWHVGTLEWSVSSPPPAHNFDEIPRVHRGPHELGHPRSDARGVLAQTTVLSDEAP
jgi:cytochrome c oxidase subunit 1